jgi:hypothetical protein
MSDGQLPARIESGRIIAERFGMLEEARECWMDPDAFRKELALRIQWLLDHQFERFMNILYRIDIDEAVSARIFTDTAADRLAITFADVIIERQLEKVRTRRRFSANEDC